MTQPSETSFSALLDQTASDVATLLEETGVRIQDLAYSNLLSFIGLMYPKYEAAWFHQIMARKMEEVECTPDKRITISLPPRHGKACRINELVPVLSGFKKHGDLEVNDIIFGIDGLPVKVKAIGKKVYLDRKVTLTTGETFIVHQDHEWTVVDRKTRRTETFETKEMEARKVVLVDERSGKKAYRFRLPKVRPLVLPNAELPIHPYFFGVWLGDGTSRAAQFCFCEKDHQPFDKVTALGYSASVVKKHPVTGVMYANYCKLVSKLRQLNVIDNKHIPTAYLRASIEQRLELLAGLVDTDGSVDNDGTRVRIVTVSEKLKDGIVELCYTLGLKPYVVLTKPDLRDRELNGRKMTINGKSGYHIAFMCPFDLPTVIPRKKINTNKRYKDISVAIKSIEPCEPELGNCIQVDSPDGLYLIGKTMQPTHNSMLISEFFPAWYLGRNPDHEVIFITYNQKLANDVGQRVRAIVSDPLYQEIFPGFKMSDDTASKNRFNILHPGMEIRRERPGSYLATGIDGTVTGKGAHLFIIDDPYKSMMDADSEATREAVWSFYNSVASTRLYPGAKVVLIMTRWREDDLCGRVLDEHRHEKWETLTLPALDAKGNGLWDRFGTLWYLNKKKTLPSRDWTALYQGSPIKEGGNLFKRQEFRLYSAKHRLPDFDYIIQSLDAAYGSENSSSYSAMTTWGLCYIPVGEELKRVAILLDAWEVNVPFQKLRQLVADEYENEYGPNSKKVDLLIIENKASGISLAQELSFTGINVLKYNIPGGRRAPDKEARAHMVSHLVSQGHVYLLESKLHGNEPAEFAVPFLNQVLGFPGGSDRDDYVDTLTQFLRFVSERGLLRADALVQRSVEARPPRDNSKPPPPIKNPYL